MELPYRKLAVYLLTFLAYVYSGYGSNILTNLRDAVISAESVFGDVFKNVIKVAHNFRNLNDIFDAAVEEDCIFKCPNNAPPRPNRNHRPSANGCGALGVKIDTDAIQLTEMTKCCDLHDICYDTCNKDKDLCDMEFKRCLYKHCDTYAGLTGGSAMVKTCKGAAKILWTGTLALGCRAYLDAQKTACYCPQNYGWKDKKNAKYTRGDGEL